MTRLRNVAVVAFAQAPIVACDEHRTAPEMLYPQVVEALAQCGVSRDDIDYQVAGSCDYIEGRPFGFVAALDAMGSWPPRQDLHLEMDGAFAAYYAWLRMQAGDCDTALVVGHGKVSEGSPRQVLNLQLDPFYLAPLGLDPIATAALQASAYMEKAGVTDRDLAEIAARNRQAGARNANAQLRAPATPEELMATPWVVRPLREGYVPPVGESAACLVLAAEGKAERMCDRPVWIHGAHQITEFQNFGARDLTRSESARLAARKAFEMAGIASAAEVDLVETSAATPVEEMIVCEALGIDARNPGKTRINPSGGPLAGNPLMVAGLIRLGEAFLQLSGRAGGHAVAGAQRAVAHAAQGHCLQHNLVWVLGSERRRS